MNLSKEKRKELLEDEIHEIISECNGVVDSPMAYKAVTLFVMNLLADKDKYIKLLKEECETGEKFEWIDESDYNFPRIVELKEICHEEYSEAKRKRKAFEDLLNE